MRKHIQSIALWVIAYGSICIGANAAPKNVDSLKKQLQLAPNDTDRVLLLSELCRHYTHISTDSAIFYGKQGLAVANELDWPRGIALLKNNIGNSYAYKSDQATALVYFFEALELNTSIKDTQQIADNLGNIGNVYYRQGKYDQAFQYFSQSYELNKKYGNTMKMAVNIGNMGNIYSHYFDTAVNNGRARLINKARTLGYYKTAIGLYKTLDNKDGIARNLGNIGNVYKYDPDKNSGLNYYTEALEIYKETGNKAAQSAMLINIASLYREVALDTPGLLTIDGLHFNGRSNIINTGIAHAEKALELSSETGFLEVVSDALLYLSELYAVKKDYQKAWRYGVAYSGIVDSLNRLNNEERISELEARNKLAQQDKEIQIQKLSNEKRRNLTIFMAIGILVLLGVMYIVVRERRRSDKLLLNILPDKIAERLKDKEHPIADQFESVSIVFIDIVGFTRICSAHKPKVLVGMLNEVFTGFDTIAEKYGLEKIKTIGDCYMAVAGLPLARNDHAIAAADMALELKDTIDNYKTPDGGNLQFRIGVDCGEVIAGVIGARKFAYDLWGDAVNTASRMESSGIPGEIHCTQRFKEAIMIQAETPGKYEFVSRGEIAIKSKGEMGTWLLFWGNERWLVVNDGY